MLIGLKISIVLLVLALVLIAIGICGEFVACLFMTGLSRLDSFCSSLGWPASFGLRGRD